MRNVIERSLVGWFVAVVLLAPGSLAAETFYVDPQNGSPKGDGSTSNPWKTLKQVVDDGLIETRDWNEKPYDESRTLETKSEGAPVSAGDTIVLKEGYHGSVEIKGAYNTSEITIRAAAGETPKLGRLLLQSVSNWVVNGLTVSPSFRPSYERKTAIEIDDHSRDGPTRKVTVKDCEVFSVDDPTSWSADDWDTKAVTGIGVGGDEVEVLGNTVRNVNFGINVGGENATVARNTIDGFSGDGLRGLGDHGVFAYNVVKNAYDVNDNHDDGFQSWSTKDGDVGEGKVEGIVLRGNLFINHDDPSHPLRTSLQGIGCFDGMFVDWTIVNNVIVTDHWHGITLMGARRTRVVNNTVIDLDDSEPGPPWIKVDDHKDGTSSRNVTVRNNLAPSIQAGAGVTADHNIELTDPSNHFVAPDAFDLHLVESSPAVDAGSAEAAPMLDRDRISRPQGTDVDIGAYEWHEEGVTPVDAGGSDADTGADAAAPDPDAHTNDAAPIDDTGGTDGDGADESPGSSGGCSCSTSPTAPAAAWTLLAVALVLLRRRHT